MIPAVILVRMSDDREFYDEAGNRHARAGEGVADQITRCRGLTAQLGGEPVAILVENDVSAFKRQRVRATLTYPDGEVETTAILRTIRPKFREALTLLRSGQAHMLVTLDLDRLTRDPRDLEDLIDVVEHALPRPRCASVTASLRLESDADIAMARVMVAIANKASRDTARRVANAAERRARAGKPSGGGRSFGRETDMSVRADEAAEIRAAAQAILARAPALQKHGQPYLRGPGTASAIVADLNARGIPPVRAKRWTVGALKAVFASPSMAGIATYKGAEVKRDAWVPIIPEDTWRVVNLILSDPDRKRPAGRRPKMLLSGLAVCGACGMPVTSAGTKRGSGPVYGCRQPGCRKVQRLASLLDAYVDQVVLAVLDHLGARKGAAQVIELDNTAVLQKLDAEIGAIRADSELPVPELMRQLSNKVRERELVLARPQARVEVQPEADKVTAAEYLHKSDDQRRHIIAGRLNIRLLPCETSLNRFQPEYTEITLKDPLPGDTEALAAALARAARLASAIADASQKPRGPQETHERTCDYCGKPIMARNSNRRYCKPPADCAYQARKDPNVTIARRPRTHERTCEVCGKTFLAAKRTARYCPPPTDCTRKAHEARKAAGQATTLPRRYERTCVMCGSRFPSSDPRALYDKPACRSAATKLRRAAGAGPKTGRYGAPKIYPRVCEVCGQAYMSARPDGKHNDRCRNKASYRAAHGLPVADAAQERQKAR